MGPWRWFTARRCRAPVPLGPSPDRQTHAGRPRRHRRRSGATASARRSMAPDPITNRGGLTCPNRPDDAEVAIGVVGGADFAHLTHRGRAVALVRPLRLV